MIKRTKRSNMTDLNLDLCPESKTLKHVFESDGGECVHCGKTWVEIYDSKPTINE